MAEEKQDFGTHFADNVAKAASTGAHAVKAAAQAGTGNVAGAVVEILKDERIRRSIIAIILVFALITTCCSMMIGSSITGAVEGLARNWSANWDEAWEEQAVASNGSALYQYSIGLLAAECRAAWNTMRNMFVTTNVVDGEDRNNSSIEGGLGFDKSDYDQTIISVEDDEALLGEDGALRQRIDMVKGRLKQRGIQLQAAATSQYLLETIGIAIGEGLAEFKNNPILFAGIDLAGSSINIDTSAFEMSDIQALKILAAYSVQNDCDLTDVGMWDFLDYCGWYALDCEPLDSVAGTIYDTSSQATFGQEIGGVVQEGEILDAKIYNFAPPTVPVWSGTCAPQWYYEEIAQINKHNDDYFFLTAQGASSADDMIPWGVTSEEDELDLSRFKSLSNVETYGIIDKMFVSTRSTLTIERSEYTGADEWSRESIAKLGSYISRLWDDSVGEKSKKTSYGNTVYRDDDNNHSFTLVNGSRGTLKKTTVNGYITTQYRYFLRNTTDNTTTPIMTVSKNGASLVFTDLQGDASYQVIEQVTVIDKTPEATEPTDPPEETLPFPTKPGIIQPNSAQTGTFETNSASKTTVTNRVIDSFSTFEDTSRYQAYQLRLTIDVSFAPRSVDELTLNLLGLWPGSLENTEIGEDGYEYAEGYTDNANLKAGWTDTYTAPDGTRHILSFDRQYGYQLETYQSIVQGTAEQLGYDTTGLYSPSYGYGDDIVSIAKQELAYYQANNLSGGARYWSIVNDVLGWTLDSSQPWCCCFVYCCAYQCGYITEDGPFGPNWTFSCTNAWKLLVNSGLAQGYSTADYKPVAGDLILFGTTVGTNVFTHIGIVDYVEDNGKLHVIEGNTGNKLKAKTYASYRIGQLCWSNIYITGYIHPNYPVSYIENPKYLSVTGTTSASATARYTTSGSAKLLLVGTPRFRESQLQDVVTQMKSQYPELYSSDLQTALDGNDMAAFITAWNKLYTSGKASSFREAQQSIAAKLFIRPLVQELKEKSGFDWSATTAREQLLWGFATTTDQTAALKAVLSALTADMSNSISDVDLLAALKNGNLMRSTLDANKNYLWPNDAEAFRSSWISGLVQLLDKLE